MKILTVKLADVGEGVAEGEVVEWHKEEGDMVSKNESVLTITTDKVTIELSSPAAGKLTKCYHKKGCIALIGNPIYDIELNEENKKKLHINSYVQNESHDPSHFHSSVASIRYLCVEENVKKNSLAIPFVRKLAKELSIDLDQVHGTGKEGRVTTEDLMDHCRGKKGVSTTLDVVGNSSFCSSRKERISLTANRRIIASKMIQSKQSIPHFSFFDQADATALIALRTERQKTEGGLTYMPFFIQALSSALKRYPVMNSSIDLERSELIIHHTHNIGIACNTARGLVVPVLQNVGEMDWKTLTESYSRLVAKARAGLLSQFDLEWATITISNFGPLGGLWATPIIHFPQTAILAIAEIRKVPIIKDGAVVARDMINLSWSFDHRVVDGKDAADFSRAFVDFIEQSCPFGDTTY